MRSGVKVRLGNPGTTGLDARASSRGAGLCRERVSALAAELIGGPPRIRESVSALVGSSRRTASQSAQRVVGRLNLGL